MTKVGIAPEAVLKGAAVLLGVRASLPSGSLPRLAGSADHAVDAAVVGLEDWWTTMATGTSDDVAAAHQLVTSGANAHVERDHQAAVDIAKSADPFAAFRAGSA
ncbi:MULTISPECIES: hypothetical protein [unclassified Leifsonia]|uniref:hypothetical protein n=1 Tax=unclassified Leifsonia TaxID=2663824 RepID=UPI0008A805C0|nr:MULTISPECIES: hypothetical protein [unclassified Leifsonia]SEH78356.1 hypothetical protein SAMN04515694_10433 [Leifsonia sp. CL154]SFL40475.1 hypothetical protein SAMN04515692_10432 [Leifsonia sp. CL147]